MPAGSTPRITAAELAIALRALSVAGWVVVESDAHGQLTVSTIQEDERGGNSYPSPGPG